MVEIIFNYNQVEIIIQTNLDDLFNTIIQKYKNKSQLDINNLCFICNGEPIPINEKISNIMNESEKLNTNRKSILVLTINININEDITNMVKSKDIIFPICKEICIYEIKDHKIKLFGCKNGHIVDNIKLVDFNNKQYIDISQIICDK